MEVIRDNYISENFIDFTESFLEGLKEDFLHGDFLSLEDEGEEYNILSFFLEEFDINDTPLIKESHLQGDKNLYNKFDCCGINYYQLK